MNVLEEYLSHNLNYKGIVCQIHEGYEVIIYHWNEDQPDSEGKPTWERIAGPFPVENLAAANALAQTQLADLAGENQDLDIDQRVQEAITSVLGHQDFAFLKANNFTITHLPTPESEDFIPLDGHKVLLTGEFYYVLDSEDQWWSGFLYDEGQIRCWQVFPDLPTALNATC